MRYKSLRYFYIAAMLLFFGNLLGSCLVFLQVHNTTHFYFVNPIPYLRRSNFDCYKMRTQNTANITSARFFSTKSIFFHSLWCNQIINEAGACAIESAARLHPQMSINLIFVCPVTKDTWSRHLDALIKLPNFRMIGVQIDGYANGTEFEKIWRSLISYNKISDLKAIAEYVKFLTLHRFGGIVLDLDVILIKPLDILGANWIVMNTEWILSTDAMAIQISDAGHNITTIALRHLSRQIIQRNINASNALEAAFVELCPNHNLTRHDIKGCQDFSIIEESLFHPISRENWKQYYLPGNFDKDAFAHRVWDDEHPAMTIPHETVYGNIAQSFCPWVQGRRTYAVFD